MSRTPKNTVTDHAVLRWLERFGYVDVEKVRKQIHSETKEALNSGATKLKINGIEYRMRDGKVVTLIAHRKPLAPLKWNKRP